MSTRVFVGMSGGVDSSVAAKRLLERGYDVVGVFIKVWQPDFIHCDWEKERLDAMRVAAHLGIPFLTMNAEDAYKREVADYMINAYKSGITPNPDVMCNEHVKFGAFYTWAREHGADMVATGHYAQTQQKGDMTTLETAHDQSKDQTYFLWRIKNEVLPHILFPIGDTLKSDIRIEAEKAGLPNARKSDSQGICFLGEIDMFTFLSHYIDLENGSVLNTEGKIVGTHRGALLYTLGQRHGFTIENDNTSTPHYVVNRDLDTNTITVSTEHPVMKEHEIRLSDIIELGSGFSENMKAVLRYHGKPEVVDFKRIDAQNGILKFAKPMTEAYARGQSCVLYRDTECVGGGIIM